jgi:ATP:cob(I)alamin adenosyltransferase
MWTIEMSNQTQARKKGGNIYTKVGDAGETMLIGKKMAPKDSRRVEVYGTLDEATSALGLARAATQNDDICRLIIDLQGELIEVMAELATPPGGTPPVEPVSEVQVGRLEEWIDFFERERIPSSHFVRPGGSFASAALDLARTIVRRAERSLVKLNREEGVSPPMLRYFNRLSDLCYVLARVEEQREIKKVVEHALHSALLHPAKNREASMELNRKLSLHIIEAGIQKAQQMGVPMVLAVVDGGGHLIELSRMDNALLVSLTLAVNKASSAVSVRLPTHELARLAQPGEQLHDITSNVPNLTTIGGGFPIHFSGTVIGGVGVSGGSVEQDITVAQAMLDALNV